MKQFHELEIIGLYRIENFFAADERGCFVKTYHQEKLSEIGFTGAFEESYYSQSKKNVIRGMHFQLPPHDHEKLVYVTQGKILDVVLDIRKESPTYGKYVSIELEEFKNSVFIPKGCAHGFLTLSDNATVVYNVTTVYNANTDTGIKWDSFGFNWKVQAPIISSRDNAFANFADYLNRF